MSIRYDYDAGRDGPGHPYRNQPRWLLQARERETWTREDYRGVRTRCTHWTRWRTVSRYPSKDEAFAGLMSRSGVGLTQWRVSFNGKAVTKDEAGG